MTRFLTTTTKKMIYFLALHKGEKIKIYKSLKGLYYYMNCKGQVKKINKSDFKIIG